MSTKRRSNNVDDKPTFNPAMTYLNLFGQPPVHWHIEPTSISTGSEEEEGKFLRIEQCPSSSCKTYITNCSCGYLYPQTILQSFRKYLESEKAKAKPDEGRVRGKRRPTPRSTTSQDSAWPRREDGCQSCSSTCSRCHPTYSKTQQKKTEHVYLGIERKLCPGHSKKFDITRHEADDHDKIKKAERILEHLYKHPHDLTKIVHSAAYPFYLRYHISTQEAHAQNKPRPDIKRFVRDHLDPYTKHNYPLTLVPDASGISPLSSPVTPAIPLSEPKASEAPLSLSSRGEPSSTVLTADLEVLPELISGPMSTTASSDPLMPLGMTPILTGHPVESIITTNDCCSETMLHTLDSLKEGNGTSLSTFETVCLAYQASVGIDTANLNTIPEAGHIQKPATIGPNGSYTSPYSSTTPYQEHRHLRLPAIGPFSIRRSIPGYIPPDQRPLPVSLGHTDEENFRGLMFEYEITAGIQQVPGSFLSKRPEWQVSVYKGLPGANSQLGFDLSPSVIEVALETLIASLVDNPRDTAPLFSFTCTASSIQAVAKPNLEQSQSSGHGNGNGKGQNELNQRHPRVFSDSGRGRYRKLELHFGRYSAVRDGRLLDPEKVHWRMMHETACWFVCEISEGKGHPARIRELLSAKIELILELKNTRSTTLVHSAVKDQDSDSSALLDQYVQIFVGIFAAILLSLEHACVVRYRRGEWKALETRRGTFRRGLEVVVAIIRAGSEMLKPLINAKAAAPNAKIKPLVWPWRKLELPTRVPQGFYPFEAEVRRQLRITDLILGELGRVLIAFSDYEIGLSDLVRIERETLLESDQNQNFTSFDDWIATFRATWNEARFLAARSQFEVSSGFGDTTAPPSKRNAFHLFFHVPVGLSAENLWSRWGEAMACQYGISDVPSSRTNEGNGESLPNLAHIGCGDGIGSEGLMLEEWTRNTSPVDPYTFLSPFQNFSDLLDLASRTSSEQTKRIRVTKSSTPSDGKKRRLS
ncbi:hypothetical protein IAT40_006029 [Kwoniella sp. CBS 6097]